MPAIALIRQLVDLHRRQIAGIVELRGVRRMGGIYEEARGELEQKLRRLVRAGKGQTFGAQHLRLILGQVTDTVRGFEGDLQDHLVQTGRLAATVTPRQVAHMVGTVETQLGRMTPVIQSAQVAVVRGVYPSVAPTLLDRYRLHSKLYGPQAIASIKNGLAQMMIQGEDVDQAVTRVVSSTGLFENQRWRAERIVRTETSWTIGVSRQRALEQLKPAVPQMMKRLVATHDDREGDDSKDLDGQTVPVDQPFIWKVRDSRGALTGKVVRYMQPPNRPNDREVVIPWVAAWGSGPVASSGPVVPEAPAQPDA